jgi:hypothetical protein
MYCTLMERNRQVFQGKLLVLIRVYSKLHQHHRPAAAELEQLHARSVIDNTTVLQANSRSVPAGYHCILDL